MLTPIRCPSSALTLSLSLMSIVGIVPSAAAVSLSLFPASQQASPGETIPFTLLASDPAPSVIGGYDLDITFDAAIVSIGDYAPTAVLGDLSIGDAFNFSLGNMTPGVLNLTVLSTLDSSQLATMQQGQFALATFTITLGPTPPPGGTTSLVLEVNALSDGDGTTLAVTSLDGATLSGIPEPSTALLVGAGLVALGVHSRPKR